MYFLYNSWQNFDKRLYVPADADICFWMLSGLFGCFSWLIISLNISEHLENLFLFLNHQVRLLLFPLVSRCRPPIRVLTGHATQFPTPPPVCSISQSLKQAPHSSQLRTNDRFGKDWIRGHLSPPPSPHTHSATNHPGHLNSTPYAPCVASS